MEARRPAGPAAAVEAVKAPRPAERAQGAALRHLRTPVRDALLRAPCDLAPREVAFQYVYYQHTLSKHFKTNHMELDADEIEPEIFYKLVKHYDEPMVDSSMIPTLLLSKEMPKGFVCSRSFHIAPDKGMAIMWFKTQKDLDNAFPIFKDFQKKIVSQKFYQHT